MNEYINISKASSSSLVEKAGASTAFNSFVPIKEIAQANYKDTDNIFGFLYKISVGIERLQKIAYILLKNPTENKYQEIEKEIITHSHTGLQEKINKLTTIKLNDHQKAFLNLLTSFYNSSRYDRYNYSTQLDDELQLFFNYVEERLKIKIEMYDFFIPQIDKKVKRFIGRVILGLAQGLYSIIREQAGKIGLYTYEIAADSKSMKVFLSSFDKNSLQEQIIDEHIAFKEFLIFLLNTTKTSGLYEFMKEIKPLNLDIAMVQEYLSEFVHGEFPQQLIDEIEFAYSEEDIDIKERLAMLECIGDTSCYFDIDEDEDDFFPFEPYEN